MEHPVEFWDRVAIGEGCWPFGTTKGYGRFRGRAAHRVSWEIAFGPIPDGQNVCHNCDNPPCVRPTHLFLGTNKDNMADASAKGRLGAAPLPMTLTDAARVLGIAPSTLRHQVRLGKFDAIKMGRDWMVTAEEVERYRKESKR